MRIGANIRLAREDFREGLMDESPLGYAAILG
jgi:hypothetical protein